MGEEKDRSGEPPRIVPPPRVQSIRTPSNPSTAPPATPGPAASWRLLAWLGFLVILAGITLFLVPRWVDRSAADPAPSAGLPAEPDAEEPGPAALPAAADGTPVDLAERARQKTRAEDLQVRAAELGERLRAREVTRWSAVAFEEAGREEARGAELLAAGRYGEAEDAYAAAVARLETIDSEAVTVLQEQLSAGRDALAAGDADAAREAFGLAVSLAPDSVAATAGLDRAEALEPVANLLRDGTRMERNGDLQGAARAYRDATSLDPMSRMAQDALARVDARLRNDAFASVMSEGLASLSDGEYGSAREAFARANGMRPGSPQVIEALAQLDEAEKLQGIALHRARARVREEREDWEGARQEYEAVLGFDPNVQFAREGRDRAAALQDLTERLAFHIARPDRLSDDDVFAEAVDLLDEARTVSPQGPNLQQQLAELSRVIESADTRVRVRILSDNRTEVTVYRVGALGAFEEKDLVLRPGSYTVVGSRRGYRDVRRMLVVRPDGSTEPLVVRCEERI